MCGRYSLATPWQRLAEHFGIRVEDVPQLFPRYNIAPTQTVLAVGLSREGQPAPAFFRWGLVPSRARDDKLAPINARAESAAKRPTFADALRHRRCLIVADGFYEWQKLENGKQTWHFHMTDHGPFAFAGLWDAWRPHEGAKPLLSCALLTVDANDIVKPVHNRMPAILRPADYAAWIDRERQDPEDVLSFVQPFDSSAMEATPVGPFVNDPRHEGPECLASPA